MPVPLPIDDWRCRWLHLGDGDPLHRVASIAWDDAERIGGIGTTVCGRRGRMQMPGFLSRMAMPRCKACCRMAGVPEGKGNPYNHGIKTGA